MIRNITGQGYNGDKIKLQNKWYWFACQFDVRDILIAGDFFQIT